MFRVTGTKKGKTATVYVPDEWVAVYVRANARAGWTTIAVPVTDEDMAREALDQLLGETA